MFSVEFEEDILIYHISKMYEKIEEVLTLFSSLPRNNPNVDIIKHKIISKQSRVNLQTVIT